METDSSDALIEAAGASTLPEEASAPLASFLNDLDRSYSTLAFLIDVGDRIDRLVRKLPNWAEKTPFKDALDELLDPLLLELFFSRSVDSFLTFLSEVVGSIFRAKPETLRSAEQVRVDDVLRYASMDDLIDYLAKRRVDRLAYQGVAELTQSLADRPGLELFGEGDQLNQAVRIVAMRNLFVHNRGIINETYLHQVAGAGVVGDRIKIEDFHGDLAFLARTSMTVDAKARAKFGLAADSRLEISPLTRALLFEMKHAVKPEQAPD
jgi:hypothetical protein